MPDLRHAHTERRDAGDEAGVNPRTPSTMPRGEDDEQTRAASREFHDRPGGSSQFPPKA